MREIDELHQEVKLLFKENWPPKTDQEWIVLLNSLVCAAEDQELYSVSNLLDKALYSVEMKTTQFEKQELKGVVG